MLMKMKMPDWMRRNTFVVISRLSNFNKVTVHLPMHSMFTRPHPIYQRTVSTSDGHDGEVIRWMLFHWEFAEKLPGMHQTVTE